MMTVLYTVIDKSFYKIETYFLIIYIHNHNTVTMPTYQIRSQITIDGKLHIRYGKETYATREECEDMIELLNAASIGSSIHHATIRTAVEVLSEKKE